MMKAMASYVGTRSECDASNCDHKGILNSGGKHYSEALSADPIATCLTRKASTVLPVHHRVIVHYKISIMLSALPMYYSMMTVLP